MNSSGTHSDTTYKQAGPAHHVAAGRQGNMHHTQATRHHSQPSDESHQYKKMKLSATRDSATPYGSHAAPSCHMLKPPSYCIAEWSCSSRGLYASRMPEQVVHFHAHVSCCTLNVSLTLRLWTPQTHTFQGVGAHSAPFCTWFLPRPTTYCLPHREARCLARPAEQHGRQAPNGFGEGECKESADFCELGGPARPGPAAAGSQRFLAAQAPGTVPAGTSKRICRVILALRIPQRELLTSCRRPC